MASLGHTELIIMIMRDDSATKYAGLFVSWFIVFNIPFIHEE